MDPPEKWVRMVRVRIRRIRPKNRMILHNKRRQRQSQPLIKLQISCRCVVRWLFKSCINPHFILQNFIRNWNLFTCQGALIWKYSNLEIHDWHLWYEEHFMENPRNLQYSRICYFKNFYTKNKITAHEIVHFLPDFVKNSSSMWINMETNSYLLSIGTIVFSIKNRSKVCGKTSSSG